MNKKTKCIQIWSVWTVYIWNEPHTGAYWSPKVQSSVVLVENIMLSKTMQAYNPHVTPHVIHARADVIGWFSDMPKDRIPQSHTRKQTPWNTCNLLKTDFLHRDPGRLSMLLDTSGDADYLARSCAVRSIRCWKRHPFNFATPVEGSWLLF